MNASTPILTTKIQIPPLAPNFLPRKRLYEALDIALQPIKRLTLISAPAGYGKTSLVSAWIQDRAHPAAWISLDEQDNDPVRFGQYLLATLQAAFPDLEPSPVDRGQLSLGEYQENVLIPLLNQLGQSARTSLIVLDDYHLIKDPSIEQTVEFLLENLPAAVHVFLLTRADPALPIARLRGRGQLNELRMQQLQFLPDEVESLLSAFKDIHLSKEDIQTLTRRTEGWIAGLQMAVASLRGHHNQSGFIEDFSGGHQYIMEYLLEEVLRRQTPELQSFLLNTSILNRLCGPLCDAVMKEVGDDFPASDEVLKHLSQANLFVVPLDTDLSWFRYHRLFSDLLEARLTSQFPERPRALHARASAWYEEHDHLEDAMRHALRSQNHALAADLLERVAEGWLMRSETATFIRWVQRLPPSVVASRPRLVIYQAWALLFQGAPMRVVDDLIPSEDSGSELPGGAELLRSFVTLSQGNVQEGLTLAQRALELLPQEEIFLRDFAVFCAAGGQIAAGDVEAGQRLLEKTTRASLRSGNRSAAVIFLTELAEIRLKEMRLSEARHLYEQAREAAADSHGKLLPIGGRALIGLGSLAMEHNQLEEAEALLNEGIELSRRWNIFSALDGHLTLATLYQIQGAQDKIDDKLDEMFDLARRFDATDVDDIVVALVAAGLKARQGDFQYVQEWVHERGLERAPAELPQAYQQNYMQRRMYKYELPILIRFLTAEERFEEAHTAIVQLLAEAGESNRLFLVLEGKILLAELLYAQGQLQPGLSALREALEMAQPVGATHLFLAEGRLMKELLVKLQPGLDSPQLSAFVDGLLGRPKQKDESDASPLSRREMDVLRLLPTDLTAEEMADELVITVNTIRTHMKNIYAKLDVHSRHQAVDKARLQGLI
ncbi:MAG: LuxR C-terminal-related transcriptional regulator [Anaerolineales bacterium]